MVGKFMIIFFRGFVNKSICEKNRQKALINMPKSVII